MRGSAPGRLDLIGGVADYSGALVLEMPTRQRIEVVAHPDTAFVVGPATFSPAELERLAGLAYEDIRRELTAYPRWTHYVIGVAVVLVRHGVLDPPTTRLEITSDLPASAGVASSAALEVATARALGAGAIDPLRLAALCQEAENRVVGAPCGIMDQVAVVLGTAGAVLPILCRPASVGGPGRGAGGSRDRGLADGSPPQRRWRAVRASPGGGLHGQAHGGGRRRAGVVLGQRTAGRRRRRNCRKISMAAPSSNGGAPAVTTSRRFDPMRRIQCGPPHCSACRSTGAPWRPWRHWRDGEPERLGPLMEASQDGYDAMGLGHEAATAIVKEALARPGVLGARSSGGGCGGTVVVVCERGALDDMDVLIR